MITVRDLQTDAELKQVEELQREVWGFADLDIVSASALRVALEIGGILLGAFDGPDLIAFNSGFYGFRRGHHEIHSDMLAVREPYRDRGVGLQLKLAQRERALARGIDRVTWTFDPLRSRNAYFNFRKLGVLSNEYRVNFYGESTSSFLHAIGTDRLWITWLLRRRSRGASEGGLRPRVTIEIPRDIDSLDAEQQWRWRERTRAEFRRWIDGEGYTVTDYDGNGRYTLEQGALEDFAE